MSKPLPFRYTLIEPDGREIVISTKEPLTPAALGVMVGVVASDKKPSD